MNVILGPISAATVLTLDPIQTHPLLLHPKPSPTSDSGLWLTGRTAMALKDRGSGRAKVL